MAVSLQLWLGDMLDEAAGKGAAEYLSLMLHEDADAEILELADDTGTHIHHLLVVVGDALVDDALADAGLRCLIEEAEQHLARLVKRQYLQFVGVLDVHYLIADIIGGLYEIY